MRSVYKVVAAALTLSLACPARSQQVDIRAGSVVEIVAKLRAGEFIWAPQIAPNGPMMLIVNLKTQRAILYRNGIPIGASTVSTGRPGYRTPTGVFTILQKHVEHYSSKYDSAPMPYMERLTWYGVALHAGKLPGYPASHGCIRLPAGFAKLLYGSTKLGMTVVIADVTAAPRVAPTPAIISKGSAEASGDLPITWNPEKSPSGPVSVIISGSDRRALVLRDGIIIGSAPVTVKGTVSGTWAYSLRGIDKAGQHWVRVPLTGASAGDPTVPTSEWDKFSAPESFKKAVAEVVEPGMTIIVTPDSLSATAPPVTILESEG